MPMGGLIWRVYNEGIEGHIFPPDTTLVVQQLNQIVIQVFKAYHMQIMYNGLPRILERMKRNWLII